MKTFGSMILMKDLEETLKILMNFFSKPFENESCIGRLYTTHVMSLKIERDHVKSIHWEIILSLHGRWTFSQVEINYFPRKDGIGPLQLWELDCL